MKELIDKNAFKAMQQREADARAAKRKAELLAILSRDINTNTVNQETAACLDEYYQYIGHPMKITSNGLVRESSMELLNGLARLVKKMQVDITCDDLEAFL